MYDPAVINQTQTETAGMAGGSVVIYTRLPWLALVLWPLAQLPYVTAHAIWFLLRFFAVIGFTFLWPHSNRSLTAIVCCWSMPLAAGLNNGQDAPILLLWIALSERLQESGKPTAAGAVFALCTAKFHLFLLLPLFYLVHRRWNFLAGLLGGCGLLGALCWVAGGAGWPAAYLRILLLPNINPAEWFMPNIHGLFSSGLTQWIVMAIVAAGSIFAITRLDYFTGFAVALTGSLLLSYHSYLQDALVMIPVVLIALNDPRTVIRNTGMLLATPIPWMLMLVARRP